MSSYIATRRRLHETRIFETLRDRLKAQYPLGLVIGGLVSLTYEDDLLPEPVEFKGEIEKDLMGKLKAFAKRCTASARY